MAVPDYQSLMLPVLLASAEGEIRISDAVDKLAQKLGFTPEERADLLPSGKQTMFSNRVHWAKTYLGKAGLLESTRRGHLKITPRGQQIIGTNPGRIDINFLNRFEEFRQFTKKSAQSDAQDSIPAELPLTGQTETPDEIMRVAHRQIDASLAQELLDRRAVQRYETASILSRFLTPARPAR